MLIKGFSLVKDLVNLFDKNFQPLELVSEVVDHLLFKRNNDRIWCKLPLSIKVKPEALLNLFMTIVVHNSEVHVVFFGRAYVAGHVSFDELV